MKKQLNSCLAAALMFVAAMVPPGASAQSDASGFSMLPVASVLVGTSAVGSAAAATVLVVPAALSTAGAILVVKAIEASARGTVYVLERASDGASASIEIAGHGLASVGLAVGASVVVSVVGASVVLSAAGEAIAFIPNALGKALLYNERVTS